jgi:hypothetical protein
MARHAQAWLALSILLTSCGGSGMPASAPQSAPPPQKESDTPSQAYPSQQQPGYAAPPSAPSGGGDFAPSPAAPPPPAGQGPVIEGAGPAVEQASLELDRAAAELSASGSDCARACKALGSMNRASERICALEPDTGTGGRCRRARERVGEAADRVRRSCACP